MGNGGPVMSVLDELLARADRRLAGQVLRRGVPMRNERPLVSFTFDDFPESAATTGARILEDHGARGTFYMAGGLLGRQHDGRQMASSEQVEKLDRAGHEIGCHTFAHVNVGAVSARRRRVESAQNERLLQGWSPERRFSSFAFPFGEVGVAAKRSMAGEYVCCRTTLPGVNVHTADLAFLKAVKLYDCEIDSAGVARWLDEAVRRNGWLIFYTHDVEENASRYGCAPSLLEHAVEQAVARGLDVLPVRGAVGRIAFRP